MVVKEVQPFIKWAGGKSKLLDQYQDYFPSRIGRYFEPFLGSAAVFFRIKPKEAILSDLNKDLIRCYRVVQKYPSQLNALLSQYQEKHSREFYNQVRQQYNSSLKAHLDRAAAFIYLNKAGYNGLYRVNKRGEFNVPFGDRAVVSLPSVNEISIASKYLRQVTLVNGDYKQVLGGAKAGDFVYLDPPYAPLNKSANFTRYTSHAFEERQQVELAEVYKELDGRGCKLLMSNSNTALIKNLYRAYKIGIIKAHRYINCRGERRGKIVELVITNFIN